MNHLDSQCRRLYCAQAVIVMGDYVPFQYTAESQVPVGLVELYIDGKEMGQMYRETAQANSWGTPLCAQAVVEVHIECQCDVKIV